MKGSKKTGKGSSTKVAILLAAMGHDATHSQDIKWGVVQNDKGRLRLRITKIHEIRYPSEERNLRAFPVPPTPAEGNKAIQDIIHRSSRPCSESCKDHVDERPKILRVHVLVNVSSNAVQESSYREPQLTL